MHVELGILFWFYFMVTDNFTNHYNNILKLIIGFVVFCMNFVEIGCFLQLANVNLYINMSVYCIEDLIFACNIKFNDSCSVTFSVYSTLFFTKLSL